MEQLLVRTAGADHNVHATDELVLHSPNTFRHKIGFSGASLLRDVGMLGNTAMLVVIRHQISKEWAADRAVSHA